MSKLCPSAQPGMENCRILGLVQPEGAATRLAYLNEHVAATPELLALSAPVKPTEVFRRAATCAEHKCPHFDGSDCRLAARIVRLLPAVVDTMPPCLIRKECRWYAQEGPAACRRCPEVTTVSYDVTPEMLEVSGLPVMQEN